MKKTISIIMAMVMIVSVFSLCAFAEDDESNLIFSATVKGCDVIYRDGETIYIEKGTTVLIDFNVFDSEGNEYAPGWYPEGFETTAYELAPEPEVIDDIFYASINTENSNVGDSCAMIVNAYSAEKFADPNFDFVTTEPDATFSVNIAVMDKLVPLFYVDGQDKPYSLGDTITVIQGETIKVAMSIEEYPEFLLTGFNPTNLREAGFTVNDDPDFLPIFDDDPENEFPFVVISAENVEAGTEAVLTFGSNRIEDLIANDWNWTITPALLTYDITIKVVPANECSGDANGDGKVSVVDAKWILQSVANTRALTDEQKASVDVNKDGKISVVDAKWILQAVAGTRVL